MSKGVTVEGQKQIQDRLRKIERTAKNRVEDALITGALMVERDAKINTPVDTGRLRASITHEAKDFGSDSPSVEVGTNVEYAKHVEFGTSKSTAKPYLFPAFNSNKRAILKAIAKALKEGTGVK